MNLVEYAVDKLSKKIPNIINPVTSLVSRIYSVTSAARNGNSMSGSLTELSKSARVEPFTIISDDLMVGQDYMHDVLDTVLSVFSAYYLQAIALDTDVNGVKVGGYLDKFSPSRGATDSDVLGTIVDSSTATLRQLGVLGASNESFQNQFHASETEIDPPYLNKKNYYFSLPFRSNKITLENANNASLSHIMSLEDAILSDQELMTYQQSIADIDDFNTQNAQEIMILADQTDEEETTTDSRHDETVSDRDTTSEMDSSSSTDFIGSGGGRRGGGGSTTNSITGSHSQTTSSSSGTDERTSTGTSTRRSNHDKIRNQINARETAIAHNNAIKERLEGRIREHNRAVLERDKIRAQGAQKMNELSVQHSLATDLERQKMRIKNAYDQKPVDDKGISEIKESSNQAIGKIFNVSIVLNGYKFTVPITVRLVSIPARVDRIAAILAGKKLEEDFNSRWKRWRAGRIQFFRDLIFCQDLIDEHKRRLMEDDSGVLMAIERRKSGHTLANLSSADISMADATNIFIISKDVEKRIEGKIGGKLSSNHVRNKIFAQTYAMIIVVVDKAYERITIYTRGISMPSTFSFRELRNKTNKSNDAGVMELLKQLTMGNPPSF